MEVLRVDRAAHSRVPNTPKQELLAPVVLHLPAPNAALANVLSVANKRQAACSDSPCRRPQKNETQGAASRTEQRGLAPIAYESARLRTKRT